MVIKLTSAEIMEEPFFMSKEQTMLKLLSKKGAPVTGQLYYYVKFGYKITRSDNPIDDSVTFEFEEIEE